MRLCTFVPSGGSASHLGLLADDNKIVDLAKTSASSVIHRHADMISLVRDSSDADMCELADISTSPPAASLLHAGEYKLLAPIPRPPRNVFCVGKNYLDHVQEINNKSGNTAPVATPKYAQLFTKAPECVVASGDAVPSHEGITRWLDYEVELGVIIGKQGKNISKDDAMNHVFGWTIGNDISARDLQKRHVQFFKGKTLDGSCPLGPCIVPKQFLSVEDLSLKLWVNGELRQNGRTSQMIFDVPSIIEQLSAGFTLLPGDIILTGTPAGVGYAMEPPQALKTGDIMRLEIENIGILENFIV